MWSETTFYLRKNTPSLYIKLRPQRKCSKVRPEIIEYKKQIIFYFLGNKNEKYLANFKKMEKIILGIELRNQGKNYFEISKIIDVSPPTVSKWLKEYEKK